MSKKDIFIPISMVAALFAGFMAEAETFKLPLKPPGTYLPLELMNSRPATLKECPIGGVSLESGHDKDGNWVLTQDEITRTVLQCNGANGGQEKKEELCTPCRPEQIQEVNLEVTSSQVDESYGTYAGSVYWHASTRAPGLPSRKALVHSTSALRSLILSLARGCERIKVLSIDAHGAPGLLEFGDETLTYYSMEKVFSGLDCAMAPEAEVQIAGCNVAKGCRGGVFLRKLADALLRKGGSVRAMTNYAIAFSPSLNLDTQILKVGQGAEIKEWDDPPSCFQELKDACAKLERTWDRVFYCPMPEFPGKEALSKVRLYCRKTLESNPSTASQKEPDLLKTSHASRFTNLLTTIDNADYFEETATDGIGPCRPDGSPSSLGERMMDAVRSKEAR